MEQVEGGLRTVKMRPDTLGDGSFITFDP